MVEHLARGIHIYLLRASVPGGVTYTYCMFADPAWLPIVAVYDPLVAELAVILSVKLKVAVPSGALEQGKSFSFIILTSYYRNSDVCMKH